MANIEPDQQITASSQKMSLTSDHRMVYRPAGEQKRAFRLWLLISSIVVVGVAVVLMGFLSNNRSTSLAADPNSSERSINIPNPTIASPAPVLAIAVPSPEWMSIFKATTQSAYKAEEASLLSSMSLLLRLQPGPTNLTVEQRALMRSHNSKGLTAIKASQYREASDEFFAAYQIDSADAEVAENLGYALAKVGKFEPASHALLRSIMAAPKRSTAWGNLGGAYARLGEHQQAIAAFSLSLRYAKSPIRTLNNLVALYREDSSEAVRAAAGGALAGHYSFKVDPSLQDHLGSLSQFPFAAFLPARLQQTDDVGVTTKLVALNNSDFPITASSTEYSIKLGTKKDCRSEACTVGRIAGTKSSGPTDDQGSRVNLVGGVTGVVYKAAGNQLPRLTIERGGILHTFSLGDEASLVAIANSALSLGPIPVSIFTNKSPNRTVPETSVAPESPARAPSLEAISTLLGVLTTSPKGSPLSTEQIYARASASVVVVTASDAQGSGVVVAPEIVITNCHVTKQGDITVFYRKAKYSAVAVAGNEELDYCILKVSGLPAAAAAMGPLAEVAPGQRVYSLGSPRGFELTFAEGMVSALRPKAGVPLPIIQTTAPISPGSSGGGLFDEFGRLIGITTFFRVESQNLNFAMPVELYRYVAPAFVPKPRLAAPAALPLAVTPQEVRQPPAQDSPRWPASACNIEYDIDLQTFGESVSVELRNGAPGSSRVVGTQKSQGGRVSFEGLCPGGYFVAIGNDDYVSVTPTRQFSSNNVYTSRLTMQRGSGNVTKQSRKNL